jgi:hypothetical protein
VYIAIYLLYHPPPSTPVKEPVWVLVYISRHWESIILWGGGGGEREAAFFIILRPKTEAAAAAGGEELFYCKVFCDRVSWHKGLYFLQAKAIRGDSLRGERLYLWEYYDKS